MDCTDLALVSRFGRYLCELVKEIRPKAICEEYSESSISNTPGGAISVAQEVATSCGINHVFCDPDRDERKALYSQFQTTEDADKKNGYYLREGVWLEKMRHLLPNSKVLFLCGADHIKTFEARLLREGFEATVHCEDLAKEWSIDSP